MSRIPTPVRAPGVIWIVFGCLLFLSGVVSLTVAVTLAVVEMQEADRNEVAPGPAPLNRLADRVLCGGPLLHLVFAGVFIHVGTHTIRGRFRDTLGNAVVSILIGVVNLAVSAWLLLKELAHRGEFSLPAGTGVLAGLTLILAGTLALVGREDYRAWRRWHRAQPGSAGA